MKTLLRMVALLALMITSRHGQAAPIEEIALRDGRVLRQVEVISYAQSAFTARWKGGRGVIAYTELPPDVRAEFELKRPKTPKTEDATPSTVRGRLTMPNFTAPVIDATYQQALLKREVRGQVFVTTRGGSNFKLGGVRVAVYPARVIDEFLTWRVGPMMVPIGELEQAQERYRRAGDYDEALKAVEMTLTALHTTWTLLPSAAAETTTDADGRFALEHDVGEDWVIFAMAKREIGDDTERYIWTVSKKDIPESGDVMLYNENMR
jgi:hypothetical protein